MGGDIPKRQFNARTTTAENSVCDVRVGAKTRRVFVGGGVANGAKILHLHDGRDRISNLPPDVMLCILKLLSVHDAARTSVLSKEWRYIWTMNTHLVLNSLFFSQLICNKDKDAHLSAFSRAIELIILVHTGPISSFHLYIPSELDQCLVTRWIEHFLNKGIRVLKISNSIKNAFEIPLFVCERLVELRLATWILTPLLKFGTFTNLMTLTLCNVSITVDVSFGSQLKELLLLFCTGIQHLGFHFRKGNNLTALFFQQSEEIDWRWLQCMKQLKTFFLDLATTNPNTWKPINLIKLLSNTPTIRLCLTGYTVEVLGPFHSILKGLAQKIEILKLYCVGFYNLCQLSNSLSLMRCLPNLQILWITLVRTRTNRNKVEPGEKGLNPRVLTFEHVLESLDWNGVLLDQLHTVAIQGVVGETTVLHLLKVLLASSPSLRVMKLYCNGCEEMSKIRRELQQCPKKSLAAQIYVY